MIDASTVYVSRVDGRTLEACATITAMANHRAGAVSARSICFKMTHWQPGKWTVRCVKVTRSDMGWMRGEEA